MDEPMILVKKADGTSVRVPLSSLKKTTVSDIANVEEKKEEPVTSNQESGQTTQDQEITANRQPTTLSSKSAEQKNGTLPTNEQSEKEEITDNQQQSTSVDQSDAMIKTTSPSTALSRPSSHNKLSTTTPVFDIFADIARSKKVWTPDDHLSPLEEPVQDTDVRIDTDTSLPMNRHQDVASVTSRLSFALSPVLDKRIHSLIVSRIKEIRTDLQVLEYAVSGVDQGGLGLTEAQATELLRVIRETQPIRTTKQVPPPRKTVIGAPEVVTPAIRSQAPPMFPSHTKTTLTDIHPPEQSTTTIGPIEEIGQLTLQDFRRYGQTVEEAMHVLQQKVDTIRAESYLEYATLKNAWKKSPLYQIYLAALVDGVMGTKNQTELTDEDIKAIAEFSEGLRL